MLPVDLADAVSARDRRALAKLLTAVEAGGDVSEALSRLEATSDATPIVGITGPPGAGKSTLVNALITHLRPLGLTVGVLAVDPSSPLTGGALLGDRIRMQSHADDEGVFIRSMASRGHLGGLAEAADVSARVMAHAGFDHVFLETVGVGQSEVEVMGLADLVALVLAPGWGDQVQADKAGVIEVSDLIVINKADREGVGELEQALRGALGEDGPPIVVATATTGEGISDLASAISQILAGDQSARTA
jgi:LAO/AO transport system kinase